MRPTAAVVQTLLLLWFLAFPWLPVPDYWITIGNYMGLYSIVVLGVVLLAGIGGLTSFGQAAFVGLGAYATAYLSATLGWSPWIGLCVGLAISGLAAALIGSITVRLSGHFLPLATIAWGLSLYYLFGKLSFLGNYSGLTGIPPLQILGHDLSSPRSMYVVIWLCLGGCLWLSLNLLGSRAGRAIRALASGKTMPEAMGVDTAHYKMAIFIVAALLASLSGWLYAHLQRSVSASPFGLHMGIEYLFMAVVGGIGHVWGAVVGAMLITGLKVQLQDWLPKLLGSHGNFEIVVLGGIMVVVLMRARDGLWPWLASLWSRCFPPPILKALSMAALPSGVPVSARAPLEPGSMVLDVLGASKHFGGLVAVKEMTFKVRSGEVVGLIGPNGAGKSTMFNLVSGVLPVTLGEIHFCGERIDRMPSRDIVRRGIARSFQHVHLIDNLSVLENVALGAHLSGRSGLCAAALRLQRAEEATLLHMAAAQIRRVGLADHMHARADSLALGQQRILEIARALCADPILLLLDEPAAGLRLQEKQALADLIRDLRSDGVSVLLVEHDMEFVMGLTDRLVVMEYGHKIAEGRPAEIQNNEAVLGAYLGGVA